MDHENNNRNAAGFPLWALPEWLRALVTQLATIYQTPVCLPALCALGIFSGAVGKSVAVARGYKSKRTFLNLFIVCGAVTGSGKGNIGEALSAPLNKASDEFAAKMKRDAAGNKGVAAALQKHVATLERMASNSSGADREKHLQALQDDYVKIAEAEKVASIERTLIVGDITAEKLGSKLAENDETLLTYSAEAGEALGIVLGTYSDRARPDMWLSGYSGDSVRSDRVSRSSVRLSKPCLAMFWLVQPSVIRDLLADPATLNRGLSARMLIADTKARREKDNRQDAEPDLSQWNTLIREVVDKRLSATETRDIVATADAREVFCQFHDYSVELMQDDLKFDGEVSRWRENAIKVAGLLAIAEGASELDVSLAQRGVAIVHWCGKQHLELLTASANAASFAELKKVARVLVRYPNAQLNLGPLQKSHGIAGSVIERLQAEHPKDIAIIDDVRSGAGRPGKIVKLLNLSLAA